MSGRGKRRESLVLVELRGDSGFEHVAFGEVGESSTYNKTTEHRKTISKCP